MAPSASRFVTRNQSKEPSGDCDPRWVYFQLLTHLSRFQYICINLHVGSGTRVWKTYMNLLLWSNQWGGCLPPSSQRLAAPWHYWLSPLGPPAPRACQDKVRVFTPNKLRKATTRKSPLKMVSLFSLVIIQNKTSAAGPQHGRAQRLRSAWLDECWRPAVSLTNPRPSQWDLWSQMLFWWWHEMTAAVSTAKLS